MSSLVTFLIVQWGPKMFLVCPYEAETSNRCRKHQVAELIEPIRGFDANLAKAGVWMRSARMWLCK